VSERLCEVKDGMLKTLVQIVQEHGGPLPVGNKIEILHCPFAEGHCDKTQPCRAFRGSRGAVNRQLVAEIEDDFFGRGYYRIRK
jgi:hypothetical protein